MQASISLGWLGFVAGALLLATPAAADEKRVTTTNRDRDADRDVKVSTHRDRDDDDRVKVSTTRTTGAVVDERRDAVESRAEERREVEGNKWTAAPTIGGATNGLGLGVGGRVGYTFATPIYLGGNFVYHAGSDDPARTHAYYPSAELGYDIGVSSVLLRPYGGVGALFRGGGGDANSTGLVYPGFTAHYLFPRSPAFVGADARVLLPFDGTAAFSGAGTAGLNF